MGSLQVRLFVTYLVIIMVTLGLAALSLFLLLGGYRDSISYSNLEDIGGLVNQQANNEIGTATKRGETPPAGDELLLFLRSFLNQRDGTKAAPEEKTVALVDSSGVVISAALAGAKVDGLDIGALSASSTGRCHLTSKDGADLLCVGIPVSDTLKQAFPGAAAIIVAEPSASLGAVLSDLVPRLLFSGLLGVAAALGLGFLLSQSVAAPLRNIARAARSVGRGNYQQRVPVKGPREVRDLATNFNRMTEEVQRSQQTLRDFLMNISHELKTPLTSIRGFSQAMLDGTIDDKDGVERSARIISDQSNRVLRLVEELLDLSRIESGQIRMQQEPVDLKELFEQMSDVFALRSEDTGVALQFQHEGASPIRGDFDRLEQVMNNLLDNAFRHTPQGGRVRVTARDVQQGLIQVTVSDTGRGVLQNDLPHLFDRFYRASNGGGSKGYGLGLAISREIVRAHGGDIWASSEPGRGTAFVFTLPGAARSSARASRRAHTPRKAEAQPSRT